jgi:hypothetical protein
MFHEVKERILWDGRKGKPHVTKLQTADRRALLGVRLTTFRRVVGSPLARVTLNLFKNLKENLFSLQKNHNHSTKE